MLEDRRLAVLRAIVEDYVSTHEPVGSKALVERHSLGVSPATIRNDMAALEDEGYIAQPHTSAGRIPTDLGYRLFVDRISDVKPMSAGERRAIEQFLTGAVDLDVLAAVHILRIVDDAVDILDPQPGIGEARAMFAFMQKHSPLRRGVTLDELGGAGLYLLSNLSSGVTGDPFNLGIDLQLLMALQSSLQNVPPSAALFAVYLKLPLAQLVGPGTGLDADGVKGELVEAAQRSWDDAVEAALRLRHGAARARELIATWSERFPDFYKAATEPELALHDMAALDVIVREAGGRFTSLDGTDGPFGGNALAAAAAGAGLGVGLEIAFQAGHVSGHHAAHQAHQVANG